MPRASLLYSLPDEHEEYELAVNGHKYNRVLYEFDQELRSRIKHAPDTQSEILTETYQELRDLLHFFANESGISIQ